MSPTLSGSSIHLLLAWAVLSSTALAQAELRGVSDAPSPTFAPASPGSVPLLPSPHDASLFARELLEQSDRDDPQQAREPGNWWIAIDAGYGRVDADGGPGDRVDEGWVLAFRGGPRFGRHWLAGLELGGIGFQGYDLWDPSEGRSPSDLFLVTEYHASFDGGWFLHAGGGWISYTDNADAGADFEGEGLGARLGAGYEWRPAPGWAVFTLLAWEFGRIDAIEGDDWSYDALRVSLGWSFG